MTALTTIVQEELKETQHSFQEILSDDELEEMFAKYGIQDERKRKLVVRCFFWLMIFSAGEPSQRGSLLQLIGFFLGVSALLFPEEGVDSLSKNAVSKRLKGVDWYLFRGVYKHLLSRYHDLLGSKDVVLGRFKNVWAIDSSVIALCKTLEGIFKSVHKGQSSLKLNTKYSLKDAVVSKVHVTEGKRHDSRFLFVTKETNALYLVDLGYWSFRMMKKIIDAGSFFVMRLKSSCDPLIVQVKHSDFQWLVGSRLSEIGDFLTTQIAIGEIDLRVTLSKAAKPHFVDTIRLVGLLHEDQWRFYVTNIFEANVTPQLIYELYAQRWQVEIFFNLIKNVLSLENIISRTKNGIMIEIYSALIFYLLTRIVIALAAQKTNRSIHDFSFERSHKLIRGFMLSHFYLLLQASLQAFETTFQRLVNMIASLGLAPSASKFAKFHHSFA
jgi:hypothetical protein